MTSFFRYQFALIASLCSVACTHPSQSNQKEAVEREVYNVAFLIMDGVYNTELTAPFDIFQHTKFREGIKPMRTFLIAEGLDMVTTFEGIRILPDYDNLAEYPPIDILVVPSAEHHLDSDLENQEMINFVSTTEETALFITSHCDGAFVLAKAGLLDDVVSTTFRWILPATKKCFLI